MMCFQIKRLGGYIFLGIMMMLVSPLIQGCQPAYDVQIDYDPKHPNTNTEIIFTAENKGHKEVNKIEILINNTLQQTCQSDACTYSAGPYPSYGGSKIRYMARAQYTDGHEEATKWYEIPIVTCFDDPDFTRPSQIPNSQASQTGPNLYQLSDPIVLETAITALIDFAANQGISVAELDTSDEYVEAIAWYVDQNMTWTSDRNHNPNCINTVNNLDYDPGWDFPIPANWTIRFTGAPGCNCPTLFCGDCEDHAILRAALLRALGISPHCIWDAIDAPPITHEYNLVSYQGAYRIMDYGPIDRWLQTHTWDAHATGFGWNEDNGPRGTGNTNETFVKSNTWNYPRDNLNCPGSGWTINTYYIDTCP